MGISRATLRRLERQASLPLTKEAYDAAVVRHFIRRDAAWALTPCGQALRSLKALMNGEASPPYEAPLQVSAEELVAWDKDQNLIDAYHRKFLGEPDGKRLLAWGRNPTEMIERFMQSFKNWPI